MIKLSVPTAKALWDQKLPVLTDPHSGGLIAFTRACIDISRQQFTIVLLRADDETGLSFTEVAPLSFDTSGSHWTFYDPHIAVDYSVCPPRYIMSMECAGTPIGGRRGD